LAQRTDAVALDSNAFQLLLIGQGATAAPRVPLSAIAVVVAYVALIVGAGVWANRRGKRAGDSTAGYFLAGRHMPVWAIAISMLATAQSAATFVGVPQEAFDGSLTYLSASIGSVLAGFILAAVFIPAYYRLGVSTPYQLLESRFGPGARVASSWAYLVGRIFASGSRLYVGAIPLAVVLMGERTPLTLAVVLAGFTIFAILYTLRGGLESVIWTDIVQVCVYLGAGVAMLIFLWHAIPADGSAVIDALRHGGKDGTSKLTVVELGVGGEGVIDLSKAFTVVTALTGWTLLNLAAFGTDQDLVQRLLTCKNAKQGARSAIASSLVGLPVVLLFACVGLLLWVYCTQDALMGRLPGEAGLGQGGLAQGDSADVLIRVAMSAMPGWLLGLILAGVLAAGPAGHNATLNSMASTIVADVYTPMRPGRDQAHYLRVGRLMVVVCGVVLGVFAVACAYWQARSGENLIQFVLGVMTFAYAGLLGVFLCALLTRRGTAASAVVAMIAGFVVVLLMQPVVWKLWAPMVLGTDEKMTLASPWRLCVGVAVSFAICATPRGRALESAR